MLHDLEGDGLQGSKTEKQLRESLRRHRVHGLCAILKGLQDLLLEDFHLLFGSRTQTFSICGSERERKEKRHIVN